MSQYEKAGAANVNKYDARRPSQADSGFTDYISRRPSQDPMYLQNALLGTAKPQFQLSSIPYDRHSGHLNYGTSAYHTPRATSETTPSTYHDFELSKAFRVSTFHPVRGTKGARVHVYLESSSDLLSPAPPTVSLMFASRSVPAAWTRLEAGEQHDCYKYSVHATAPPFSETGFSTSKIPLRLHLHDPSRLDANQTYIGDWLYEGRKQLEHQTSPQEASRKRKATDEPLDSPQSTKRIMSPEQQTTQSQGYGSYAYPSASSTYPQSLDFSNMQRRYTPYGRSQLQQNLRNEANPLGSQGLFGGASSVQSFAGSPMGETSSWSSSYGTGFRSGSNPQPNTTPSSQGSPIPSSNPANPRLIRLTLVQDRLKRSHDMRSAALSSHRNQAILEIRGNLDAMKANWTPHERAMKRRVVRFWREQHGTTITAHFTPIRPGERALPYTQRISCIYWEKEDDYYVTSVNIIWLLGLLLDQDKHTGDDNRIRRNISNWDSCTTSKGNAENEAFFDLVMGFEAPLAAKIKKAVKVYKWTDLEPALHKVFTKYVENPWPDSDYGPKRRNSNADNDKVRSGACARQDPSKSVPPPAVSYGLPNGLITYPQASPLQQASPPSITSSDAIPTLGPQYIPNEPFHSPYAPQASIPSLSPAYTASPSPYIPQSFIPNIPSAYAVPPISHGASIETPTTEDMLIPRTNDYYSSRCPPSNAYFAGRYAPAVTLGLPGCASEDLSAYLRTDVGFGDAAAARGRRRRRSGVREE